MDLDDLWSAAVTGDQGYFEESQEKERASKSSCSKRRDRTGTGGVGRRGLPHEIDRNDGLAHKDYHLEDRPRMYSGKSYEEGLYDEQDNQYRNHVSLERLSRSRNYESKDHKKAVVKQDSRNSDGVDQRIKRLVAQSMINDMVGGVRDSYSSSKSSDDSDGKKDRSYKQRHDKVQKDDRSNGNDYGRENRFRDRRDSERRDSERSSSQMSWEDGFRYRDGESDRRHRSSSSRSIDQSPYRRRDNGNGDREQPRMARSAESAYSNGYHDSYDRRYRDEGKQSHCNKDNGFSTLDHGHFIKSNSSYQMDRFPSKQNEEANHLDYDLRTNNASNESFTFDIEPAANLSRDSNLSQNNPQKHFDRKLMDSPERKSVGKEIKQKEDIKQMLIDAGNKSVENYRNAVEQGRFIARTYIKPPKVTPVMKYKYIVNYPMNYSAPMNPYFSYSASAPASFPISSSTSTVKKRSSPVTIESDSDDEKEMPNNKFECPTDPVCKVEDSSDDETPMSGSGVKENPIVL